MCPECKVPGRGPSCGGAGGSGHVMAGLVSGEGGQVWELPRCGSGQVRNHRVRFIADVLNLALASVVCRCFLLPDWAVVPPQLRLGDGAAVREFQVVNA